MCHQIMYVTATLLLLLWCIVPKSYYKQKVEIKAGVTIGPERRRSQKCRAEEQS